MQPETPAPVTSPTNLTTVGGTELDAVISDIPWGDAFTIGAGIDAITGSVMGTAIKPPAVVDAITKSSVERVTLIQSESDIDTEIDASLGGKFNIEGIPVNASASYLSEVRYSKLCTTLIAQYVSHTDDYDEAAQYELTDDAKSLVADHPAEFRAAYGDYFVAGVRRVSRFTAVYTCQAATAHDLQQFSGTLGADVDLFSAEGSAKFKQAASTSNITVNTMVSMEGYEGVAPGAPWTLEKAQAALQWFKEHEKGSHLQAKLKHYNTLMPLYPRSVDVDPDVFAALRHLYETVCTLRARFNSCPQQYRDSFRQDYAAVNDGVVTHQAQLPRDASKIASYQAQADALMSKLDVVFDRMDFYLEVKARVNSEPAKSVAVNEGTGQQSWLYGLKGDASSAVVVNATHYHYHGTGTTLGWETHPFEHKADPKSLIVGWEVTSNYRDGSNGSWSKGTDHILLSNYASLTVTANFNRCLDWSFTVYTVPAADYEFH